MKKFLLYILSILSILLVIFTVLDVFYTFAYTKGTPRNKISYLLSIEDEAIDYVFLGSSRVDNTIDSEIMEEVTGKKILNLGIQEVGLNDTFLMLQLLKKQNIQTETVFIQVDGKYNSNKNSGYLKSSIMPFIHDEQISILMKNRNKDFFFLKYLPFYRYLKYDYKNGFREVLNILLKNQPYVNLENGYYPLYGKSRKQLQTKLPEKISQTNPDIEAINRFAEKNNINVVYFMAPVCSEAENLDFAQKLDQKIPSLMDFSKLFLEKDDYFFDCSHLNDNGAKEFSKILGREISQLD
ncbi:hypothetical protein [Autumnicola edwardsiae]|uniref:SGNH/GDSL hydrolase family protein n=1 Tax=Autumnicola edwardsiae TaxID=3075594 RepID=A0ABU3CX13_9FLAO|nr:hypothetical protein [Zunongwangia sp. F297]MDT0650816.1 hypothetical protein [Zunongwangia sp. F297]